MTKESPDGATRGDGQAASAGRRVERWALLGVAAVVLLAIAVVLNARPTQTDGDAAVEDDSTVRVVIGGERTDDPATAPPLPGPALDPAWEPAVDPSDDPGDEPAVPPGPSSPREYVVRANDTLGAIAQRELGSVTRVGEIVELNGLSDPNAIRAGQTLLLPAR